MFTTTSAFSGFSVSDIVKAKEFYGNVLELEIEDTGMGLKIDPPCGAKVFAYAKDDHQPATFTILNFEVKDIDAAVGELTQRGVTFLHYEGAIKTDEKGIARGRSIGMGPDIAWFKDPAGNILSVLQ